MKTFNIYLDEMGKARQYQRKDYQAAMKACQTAIGRRFYISWHDADEKDRDLNLTQMCQTQIVKLDGYVSGKGRNGSLEGYAKFDVAKRTWETNLDFDGEQSGKF